MLDIIAKPFGLLLLWLYNLVGNYGIAIFLFALVVKLVMLPFQFQSQKGMMRMQALNPQVQELQRRHEGNPQKLQEEMAKLYREEKVNPMSGCIWMLIPYPILLALWRAVRFPLTTMMGLSADLLAEGGAIYEKLTELGFQASSARSAYIQLEQSQFISQHFDAFQGISDKLVNINYNFLGLNLGDTPSIRFWVNGVTWATFGLFLLPVVSALLSWIQMKVSQATNPTAGTSAQQEQAAQQMKTMNLMMPLMSLWIGFSMPGVMGLYWVFNSLLYIVQSLVLNRYFGKVLAAETAVREARMKEREAEWERKRQETERLRAEGNTKENSNTSKKKQQARQKAELDSLKAAAAREEKAARRLAKGIVLEEKEISPSQVGDRPYARGRAYIPDRFTNPQASAGDDADTEETALPENEIDSEKTEERFPAEKAAADAAGTGAEAFNAEAEDDGDAEDSDMEDGDEETDEEDVPSDEDEKL